MAKTSFWRDEILGEILELGKSTAKKSTQQISQTFSPLKMIEKIGGFHNTSSLIEKKDNNGEGLNNSTSLDFEKLEKKYQQQDKQKEEMIRQRLFQLVRQGNQETFQRYKQKEEEKERIKMYKEQEIRQKEQERRKQEASIEMPKGKIRRSIFSHKKVAQRQQAEVKPASGKQ